MKSGSTFKIEEREARRRTARAQKMERDRQRHREHRKLTTERMRKRYQEDPAFAERERRRVRTYFAEKRARLKNFLTVGSADAKTETH